MLYCFPKLMYNITIPRDEFNQHGRRKSRRAECGWNQARDVQSHPEEDPGDSVIAPHRSAGKLRPHPQRILLRPSPRGVRTSSQLLPVSRIPRNFIPCTRNECFMQTNIEITN